MPITYPMVVALPTKAGVKGDSRQSPVWLTVYQGRKVNYRFYVHDLIPVGITMANQLSIHLTNVGLKSLRTDQLNNARKHVIAIES